jgi:hypothetical protein
MTRLLLMLIGVLIGLILGAAMGIRAAEPDEATAVAAHEADVDPVHLEGAMLTVDQPDPREYLYHSGELERPRPPAPARSVWDVLAGCESTHNWQAVSRGGTYRGGLQFDQPTWRAYGGLAFAPSAHLASKGQQIAIAERLRAARGFQPWPVCSRRLGLR